MKTILILIILAIPFSHAVSQKATGLYPGNREPLLHQKYLPLPLGSISPQGHLKHMLETQRDGLTGHLDSIYSLVCGNDNGWLGGKGDCWERGPYWIDGLVPLAYILDDKQLKAKAQRWIDWTLEHQRPDGYFGPYPLEEGYVKIKGTQQTNPEDWWPKMVMLKALMQYYSATGDPRVIRLMTAYFRYQLQKLPEYPLGHWTFWGAQRGGDNLQVVLWLYSITGEPFLLELGRLIHRQTHPWSTVFTDNTLRNVNPYPNIHCVNIAQGMKEPMVYYQLSGDTNCRDAVKEGLDALRDVHGFVNGMYGADEMLHGNDPTQGSELCSAVELMYSLESMLPLSGDLYFADYLEKIAYNVLPTQADDQYLRKQYFQQVNQVMVTDDWRHFDCDYNGRIVFGTTSGYPCCLANMHQGWPKFVQNLWYATSDNGLAALVYGPSRVKARVAGGTLVEFSETTNYPFSEMILFEYESSASVEFPFYLRIPGWCKNPVLKVNGIATALYKEGETACLNRKWSRGDRVELLLPMEIRISRWFEQSAGIERGPLVYALRIEEEWKELKAPHLDDTYYEVLPLSPWNYGITAKALKEMHFIVKLNPETGDNPWNLEHAPISIITKGKRVPHWTLYENQAGKLPYPSWPHRDLGTPEEEITLIPYGCSTLRIAEFPVVDVH